VIVGVDVVVRATAPALGGSLVPLSATVHHRRALAVGEANRVRATGHVASGHVVNVEQGKLGVVHDATWARPVTAYIVDGPLPLDVSAAPLRAHEGR
jgi:hypothetical protein